MRLSDSGVGRVKKDAFTRNVTQRLLAYALGRGMERSDRALVGQISGRVAQQNYRFSALVSPIVNSPAFQMRRAEPKAPPVVEPGDTRTAQRHPLPGGGERGP